MGKNKLCKKMNLNLYNLFWIFLIGSYFGVLMEVIWSVIRYGTLESRTALIIEPLNPVYGFGVILVTIISNKFRNKNTAFIFIISMVLGATLEFILSFLQEMIFGSVSWTYDSDSLGIFHRTSLIYSVYWGILSVLYIKLIEPKVIMLLEILNISELKKITIIFAIMVTVDILFSSMVVLRKNERVNNIPASNKLDTFFDTYYNDEVISKIYPHMYFT